MFRFLCYTDRDQSAMDSSVKKPQVKSSQGQYGEKLHKRSWTLFVVGILLTLALFVRIEMVARDTRTLAQQIQQIQETLKKAVDRQDNNKEELDIVSGR